MFKKIFKAAKDVLRSPVGQLGIGLLLPGSSFATGLAAKQGLAGLAGKVLTNPALLQGGIGLLAGDKPANVLRNIAYGTALGGISNLGQPGGFMGGAKEYLGMQPTSIAPASVKQPSAMDFRDPTITGDPGMVAGDVGFNTESMLSQAKEPGFLERYGLINREGKDFFETYSPLIKLGSVGMSIAAAALGEEAAQNLYDPNKNPYLAGETKIQDVYQPLEYKKGGILDFPEKDGMINGPGNGQSDDIPAMLSDGEFVMTKQAVVAAGDGDREKGTKKMYEMMYALQDKADNMGIGKF